MTIQIAPPTGGFGSWNTWAGTFNTANNAKPAICITENIPAGLTPGGGTAFTSDPVLMREITLYADTTDPLTAAGLAYEGHTRADTPDAAAQWINSPDPNIGAIKAKAAQIRAAAQGTAGPYTVSPVLAFTPGSTKGGTVTNTQLLSATGNALTGLPATLAYTNATGTTAINTGDTANWAAAANGPVRVKESVPNAPSPNGIAYVVPGQQTMLVAGDTTTVEGISQDLNAQLDFQPVATSTAPVYLQAGQPLTDVLHTNTSTGNPNDWLKDANGNGIPATYRVKFYQAASLAPGKILPATAKFIGEGTATGTGAGQNLTVTSTTGAKTAPTSAAYYSVAEFIKNDQPANLQQYFTGDFTETDLTTQVSVVKATPTLVTTAIDNGNGTVADKITMVCDSTDTVNTPMTVTPVLNSSASAPVTGGTSTAPADNKVQATLPAVTVHCGETVTTAPVAKPWASIIDDYWTASPSVQRPTLYFTESAPATATTNELHPVYLHQDESLVLSKPTVATQASANGTVPVTATDNATVAGTVPEGTGLSTSLDWKLYKFAQDTTGSVQAVCVNPFWTSANPVNVPKAGDYSSAPVTLKDSGTYGYVETLTITYPAASGTKTAVLHEGKCGESSESVVVFPEAVTVTPDKPALLVNTGFAPTNGTSQEAGPNMPLLIVGGSALAVALLAGAGLLYRKRFANRAAEPGNVHADELTD